MGLFDHPNVDPAEAERVVGCEAHAQLALQAARESITLLKNEGNLLPLDAESVKTIAVIGPNANRSLLGGYSGVPKRDVTVLDGIRARLGKRVKVLHLVGEKQEGVVLLTGEHWKARSLAGELQPGAEAQVVQRDGLLLLVVPFER